MPRMFGIAKSDLCLFFTPATRLQHCLHQCLAAAVKSLCEFEHKIVLPKLLSEEWEKLGEHRIKTDSFKNVITSWSIGNPS